VLRGGQHFYGQETKSRDAPVRRVASSARMGRIHDLGAHLAAGNACEHMGIASPSGGTPCTLLLRARI